MRSAKHTGLRPDNLEVVGHSDAQLPGQAHRPAEALRSLLGYRRATRQWRVACLGCAPTCSRM